MRRTQKKPIKKNLFDDDDDDNPDDQDVAIQNDPLDEDGPSGKKAITRTQERYDAHQLKENEHYYGKKDQEAELEQQRKAKEESNRKGNKISKKKKKNLFDSDEQEENPDNQSQPTQQNNQEPQQQKYKENNSQQIKDNQDEGEQIKTNKSQKKEQDIEAKQEDERREQNIDELIKDTQKNKIQNQKKTKEVSFSRLIEKYELDRDMLKVILYQPIPKGFRACCIFKRVQNGLSESYQLIMEDDQKSIMFCENQRGSIGANYYISLTKEMDKNSEVYLGKLRGNSTGSQYHLYDGGKQPQKKYNRKDWRCTMARIDYETNILGMNGPRKLKIILPNVSSISDYDSFKLREDQQLSELNPPIVTKYRNKQPRWNQRLKSYALNFGGKVKQASIKNFILVNQQCSIEEQSSATNQLVFGKMDQNNFSLEVIHPISLFQAFGIVMSQFDFKLNCE